MKKASPRAAAEACPPAKNATPVSTSNTHPLLGVEEPRIEYLERTTFEYIFCFGFVAFVSFGVVFREFVHLSSTYYDQLKPNLNPPWTLFRWLGSRGVDVTDGQWYYIISFLPFALPIMTMFVLFSRRLRRTSLRVVIQHSAPNSFLFSKFQKSTNKWQADTPSLELKSLNPTSLKMYQSGHTFSRQADIADTSSAFSDLCHSKATSDGVYIGKDLTHTHLLHFLFGMIIALGVTGTDCLFGVAFIMANYYGIMMLYKHFTYRISMIVMWTAHIAVLFLHYFVGKYRFSWFGLGLLDDLWRPLFRWTMIYNMSTLRMISFNMDMYEAINPDSSAARREQVVQRHENGCVECAVIRDRSGEPPLGRLTEAMQCYKCRTDCPRALSEYNLLSYLGYMFYPPLYITGPMLSFNAYTSYLHHATRGIVGKAVWRYALRCIGGGVLLSYVMHFAHVMAILDFYQRAGLSSADVTLQSPYDDGKSPNLLNEALLPGKQEAPRILLSQPQKIMLFYALLGFLWLKLDFIWKLARLIALFDGVEPPEDMRRCFCNTLSIQSFWRDWHASFNMWIVRYMYIPMGGKKNKILVIFVIFFFIAIWHDIDVRLLYWAGLTCAFFVPEIIITSFFGTTKNRLIERLRKRPLAWRWVRIVGGQFGILELILVNLTGFMIGTAAPTHEVEGAFQKTSWACIAFTFSFLLCVANVAVQDRDQEAHEEKVLRIKYHLEAK